MRRILLGAALAGCLPAFAVAGASADVGPGVTGSGSQLLGQSTLVDQVGIVRSVAGDSLKHLEIGTVLHVEDVDATLFSTP